MNGDLPALARIVESTSQFLEVELPDALESGPTREELQVFASTISMVQRRLDSALTKTLKWSWAMEGDPPG